MPRPVSAWQAPDAGSGCCRTGSSRRWFALDALEAMAMNILFFQREDHELYHAVLQWPVRGDEFLLQAIAV